MALHTAACVLALIQYEHAVRLERIKTGAVWKRRFTSLLCQQALRWGGVLSRGQPWIFSRPRVFLHTSRGSFFLSACASNHVSLCLCTWSTWEPTPDALQMSSCLIINPAFHAYVNFIITDTCTCACTCTRMCMCTHSYSSPCAPLFPNCHSWRAVASKAAVSYLTLSPSSFSRFLASVTSHIFFFFCSFPCASPSLFPTQSLSHLCLSLLYLPAREILLQREVMLFVLFSSPISV